MMLCTMRGPRLFVFLLIISFLPVIGSRSVKNLFLYDPESGPGEEKARGSSGISITSKPHSTDEPNPPDPLVTTKLHENFNIRTENVTEILTPSPPPSQPSPCNLVPLTFDDPSSGARLLSYEDKFLIQVSHPIFQVTYGIVPSIVYQVNVQVPSGHEFSLEYWVNGIIDERSRLKRRHQRDRREVLELYPFPSTNPDQVIFCSKNSVGGLNGGSSMKLFTFHWYLATHPTPPTSSSFLNPNSPLSPSVSASSTSSSSFSSTGSSSNPFQNNPSFPTTVVFRLRFRSIVEATSSVFEQNLSVKVRPSCELRADVGERLKLSLSAVWNPRMDNIGLNCTVLIRPKIGFGFEFRLTNLSIYGIRNMCKGRYLSLTSVSPPSSGVSSAAPETIFLPKPKTAMDSPSSAATRIGGKGVHTEKGPLEGSATNPGPGRGGYAFRKTFCGKIEDYSLEERSFTFASKFPSLSSVSSVVGAPQVWNHGGVHRLSEPETEESEDLKTRQSSSGKEERRGGSGVGTNENFSAVLAISLPVSVKLKESFALELFPLSPCQKVRLTELSGQVTYTKNYDDEECSIIIHVPFGNTILTQLTFQATQLPVVPPRTSSLNDNATDYGSSSDKGVFTFQNSTTERDLEEGEMEDFEGGDDAENVSPPPEYEEECNFNSNSLIRDLESDDGRGEGGTDYTTLVVEAVDLVTGKELNWCVSRQDGTVYRRAWKSSGNRIQLKFQLNFFDKFHLSYQSLNMPDVTGDCDKGWIKVDHNCVSLQETPMTWLKAEEFCQSMNSHLLTVRDEIVEEKVHELITESSTYDPNRAYWIGANDRESEGNFQWTSGLPFIYTSWFPGWIQRGSEVVNTQPNDDGFSGQDCVEIRQRFSSSSYPQEKSFDTGSIHRIKAQQPHEGKDEKFYWNDRNCETANFFLCEKLTHQRIDFSCNQTIRITPGPTSSVIITSPAYPSSYPDNILCVTTLHTSPGYRIAIQFDEFLLEESPSCKYDSLEIYETSSKGEIINRKDVSPSKGVSGWEARTKLRLHNRDIPIEQDKDKLLERICGNWNKRLKLLRYTSFASSAQLHLKFESDFSHQFGGFKAKVWAEMEQEAQCVDQHMQKFGSNCYLFVSNPPVSWNTANRACAATQGNLVSVLSAEEWNFLTRNLMSTPHYDKKSIYWLGGFIDQSSQLVWIDRMPFNFSAFHPSDLQTISNWKCLSLYWHEGGKGDFAWRLSECNQLSGYICKKNTQVETKHGFNRTFSGTGSRITSPNFPSNYYNNLDYTNHLVAPNRTQIVIRFSHLDIESQDDCLYDYIEIIDKRTGNATRFCGTHQATDLEKLDYVSTSNQVDVVFHTDFADTMSGFEISWRAVDVTSCVSGKTILTGIGSGFPLHDATIYTPNFPHFNLPGLSCEYTIVAPAGQRIWISFQIFEIGHLHNNNRGEDGGDLSREEFCAAQDHVIIDLGMDETDGGGAGKKLNNEILLCGNLTGSPQQTSFLSYHEKITIRVLSPEGKTGRGLLGRFKAVPNALNEMVPVVTEPNSSFSLTSLNSPFDPPSATNFTITVTSPPSYVLTIRLQGKFYPKCHLSYTSYVEIRDPLEGVNGTSYMICQPEETALLDVFPSDKRDSEKKVNLNQLLSSTMDSVFTLRSSYNQIDIKEVYAYGHRGKKWNAQVITTWDENFRSKLIVGSDKLLLLKGCSPNPCLNGGKCVSDSGRHICRCPLPFTGPFCGLSLCDLNPCLFGNCSLQDKSFRCDCHLGYGGERCDRRKKPCDEKPCDHGECIETANSSYRCICHPFWEGPRCEGRMMQIPYKPLSQRMLKEPFWLGMITVTVVLGVIGLVWCLKRHFPEKLDKLLNDDLDRNRGISWVSGRSPSSIRIGSSSGIGIRDPIPGPSQQSTSPPTSRSFLGRFGIRKPSLLSLSSATSAVSVTASSPHQYENRTFSLDDLLRPTRSMMRTPSPHRRRNYSIQVRRDPSEKQQILQQLVSSGGSQSLDGEAKPATPKPTIAEIIQMSEKRLRLASASSVTSDTTGDNKKQSSVEGEAETSFTMPPAQSSMMLTPTSKAEKKVTFARLLDKLAATEMSSSSSCSDISCGEDKTVIPPPKPPERKKERKGRFRRSKSYNRGRSSETDQEGVEMSSSDTTPDPICPPRFPTRLCVSPTGIPASANTSPSAVGNSGQNKLAASKSLTKMASADSLLALFRRFSGSSSAPPSPQYSENEESSAGATPLSTPGSPRNSSLSIRPPAFQITMPEQSNNNNTIELPVLDSFSPQQSWRSGQSITLEVPLRDCCLSPIHEVPTPLPTPSHTPAHSPMMQRPRQCTDAVPTIKVLISSEDEGNVGGSGRKMDYPEQERSPVPHPPTARPPFPVPIISISVEGEEDEEEEVEEDSANQSETPTMIMQGNKFMNKKLTGETEVIPDVLIHVPAEASLESKPEYDDERQQGTAFIFPTPVRPPRLKREKNKPPPLVFANEILSCTDSKEEDSPNIHLLFKTPSPNQKNEVAVPALSIEFATPLEEKTSVYINPLMSSPITCCQVNVKPWDSVSIHPLAPPIITINQSSEAESDSDTPVVRKLVRRPNLTFLSPFVGASDRVPSESNLSTSGYSSMASPCPSRCPSVSPLCPSEAEDSYHSHHHHSSNQLQYGRRSSLTPATSRRSSLTQRRCSLNATSPLVSMSRDSSDQPYTETSENLLMDSIRTRRKLSQGFETDSAVEVEMETDGDTMPLTPGIPCDTISEETRIDLLQVPRKNMPKSRSLDMNVTDPDKRRALKGDSLDSKLNTVDPSASNFAKFMENVYTYGSILEMPEEPGGGKEKKRLSPVSSRSDSPISELSVCGHGVQSPLTDSDGIYDCPSSEVPNGGQQPTMAKLQLQQIRRSGRRRERKLSSSGSQKRHTDSSSLQVHYSPKNSRRNESPTLPVNLPPLLAKESAIVLPIAATNTTSHGIRVKSPKRRVRASSFIPSTSSSSQESLNSPRSFGSSTSLTTGSDNKLRLSVTSKLNDSPSSCLNQSPTNPSRMSTVSSDNLTGSIFSKGLESADAEPSTVREKDTISLPLAVITSAPKKETTSRKLSRLRAISHQIRFLRRLEVSLLRKKESLGMVASVAERRDSMLSWSDSSDSRCDTSDTPSSSPCESFISRAETEKPLLSLSTVPTIASRRKRRKVKSSSSPATASPSHSTSSELAAIAHKNRISQYN